MNLEQFLTDLERNLIESTLISFGGQIGKTADYLGVKRTTLSEKIRRMGINVREEKEEEYYYGEAPILKITPLNLLKMNSMIEALKANNWNRVKAANQLGISMRTIRYWIKHAKKCGEVIPDCKKSSKCISGTLRY